MIEIKTSFSKKELLWFGPLFALFSVIIGAIARWKFDSPEAAKWIWIFAVAIIFIYYLVPPLRRWIFIGWMAAVFPIGWIISHVLLTIVFYLVVFPIGILMRLLRYDALNRNVEPDAKSYWIKRENSKDPKKYFRQF